MKILWLLLLFIGLSPCSEIYARIITRDIYFDFEQTELLVDYRDNRRVMAEIIDIIEKDSARIEMISITGVATPEGGDVELNKRLSAERAFRVLEFLRSTYTYIYNISNISDTDESWDLLYREVARSEKVGRKREILQIINSEMSYDNKRRALKELDEGAQWRQMEMWVFPLMRVGARVTITLSETEAPVLPVAIAREIIKERIAAKTNLLYDVALMPNISIEIPFGEKWSIVGEWVFPWWVSRNDENALQILYSSLELRHWLGERENKAQLTGWFAGLSGGGGVYDLEHKGKGYQGNITNFGLGGGYSHTISPSGRMRMEYALYLGYIGSHYRRYHKSEVGCCLYEQYRNKRHWIGPTSAEVSLVWMLEWVNKRRTKR